MARILIVGSAGHAKVIIDIVEQERQHQIVGLIDRFRAVGESTLGYSIMGKEEDIPTLMTQHEIQGGLVAVGDNFARKRVAERVQSLAPDFRFVTATHPSAVIGRDTEIGMGTVIMAGALVNPSCRIGAFCVLNTGALLEHDSRMADFASLAPGAVTGGHVELGLCAAVNIGATVADRVHIGEHAVVGAGAAALTDIAPFTLAYGVPAKPIRPRAAGERYF